jgi:hypothetical protein
MKCGICQEEMTGDIPGTITIKMCQQHDHSYTHAFYLDVPGEYVYTITKKVNGTTWILTYISMGNTFSVMIYGDSVNFSLISNCFKNILTVPTQNNDPLFALSVLDRVIESKGFL